MVWFQYVLLNQECFSLNRNQLGYSIAVNSITIYAIFFYLILFQTSQVQYHCTGRFCSYNEGKLHISNHSHFISVIIYPVSLLSSSGFLSTTKVLAVINYYNSYSLAIITTIATSGHNKPLVVIYINITTS